MRYTVKTNHNAEGTIVQTVLAEGHDWKAVISREIVHTQDAQVRQALIALGWTPPRETPKEKP